MRTVEAIEADLAHERAALRHARECEEAADAKGDESAFYEARKRADYRCQRIDAMARERSQSRYALLSANVDRGAFSARFQAVQDGDYFSILDTREECEVEAGIRMGSVADARAREMCHFAWTREQAEKRQDRSVYAERNRAMRPA